MEQVNKLLSGVEIPDMAQVRQSFSAPVLDDPCGTLKQQLDRPEIRNLVKPGMKIAVTAGSRGIAEYIPLLRCILDSLKEMGAEPFLILAHGKPRRSIGRRSEKAACWIRDYGGERGSSNPGYHGSGGSGSDRFWGDGLGRPLREGS